jgi:hypothetical protein
MLRIRMRALLAAVSSASLVLMSLAPVSLMAGQPEKGSDHFVELFCDGIVSEDGTLFFGAALSEISGDGAGLEMYGPGVEPFTEPAVYMADGDTPPSGSFSGGIFTVDIPVLDATGSPAGSAHIEAELVASGPAEPFNDRFRDGNRWFRSEGTFLPYSIESGEATLPDGSTFVLQNDPCFADEVDVTFFGTNPTAFVISFAQASASCLLFDGDTAVGSLFVEVDAERTSAFVDAFFFDEPIGAVFEGPLENGALSAELTWVNFNTGEEIGTGMLEMSVAATGTRFSYTLRGGTGSQRVQGEAFDVEGTLTAPGFEPFDLGDCVFADRVSKEISGPFRAPKPTGAAPANDLPSGAKLVAPGRNLTQNTKNAALDMEEPFECLVDFDEEGNEFPLPVLKTVWYKVVGTGGAITIDTKGSGFDTVAAVYTKAGDTYEPVPDACVDDVPLQPVGRTLQAAVRFATEEGTTYYVQIGGFPDDLNWGSLHVRVR